MKKLFNLMAIFSLLSPVVPVLLYGEQESFGGDSPFRIWFICLPFLFLCKRCGGLSKFFVSKVYTKEKQGWLRLMFSRIIVVLSCLIMTSLPLLGGALYYGQFFFANLSLSALALYCFYVGRWTYKKNYYDLAKPMVLGVLFGVSLLCYVGIAFLESDTSFIRETIVFNILLNGLFTALIYNQANISRLLERRAGAGLSIPRNLRFLNSVIVGAVCTVILLLFLLREQIGAILGVIVSFIIGLISLVLSLLPSLGMSNSRAANQPEIHHDPRVGLAWDIAIMTIVIAVTVYFLRKYRKEVLGWVHGLIAKIKAMLRRKNTIHPKDNEKPAYVDYIEELIPHTVKKDRLKINLKIYKREKEPNKKIRLSYKLLVLWLKSKKIDISTADTPTQTIEKGDFFYQNNLDEMEKYRHVYEGVRYGNLTADQQAVS
ncbi:MAG: hypothetical protein FWH05_08135, partial [Oscillospiraceae bacterium]|nr:hypothetical protein [Oscillospiraceae bacterium]